MRHASEEKTDAELVAVSAHRCRRQPTAFTPDSLILRVSACLARHVPPEFLLFILLGRKLSKIRLRLGSWRLRLLRQMPQSLPPLALHLLGLLLLSAPVLGMSHHSILTLLPFSHYSESMCACPSVQTSKICRPSAAPKKLPFSDQVVFFWA